MMKFLISLAVVVTATFALAQQQKQQVTVSGCSTPTCGGGCKQSTFNAGECLRVQGSSRASVKLGCPSQRQMCGAAVVYKDKACMEKKSARDAVCNACNFPVDESFVLSCGAIFGSVVWVTGFKHADYGCMSPGGPPKIVGYRKCTPFGVNSTDTFVQVAAPVPCHEVTYSYWNNSASCSGAPVGQTSFWSGLEQCNEGQRFSCASSSSSSSNSAPVVAENVISVPEHMRRKLFF